jgi:hypothetical protein
MAINNMKGKPTKDAKQSQVGPGTAIMYYNNLAYPIINLNSVGIAQWVSRVPKITLHLAKAGRVVCWFTSHILMHLSSKTISIFLTTL